ncbi:MAG TPA: ABC transporter ATP-binding protein [Bdellovibrionales bacterium]|nr:MAG: ABC transporter ATP-binding protein [Bdellovibrionales bacterium GWB1_52_6]OFZ04913.1 MAG: ABC transporter ATP-binding protein [Bdellovibrionales bacterium GWA1_52_35]OFZ35249.1 MAG: ABC transporter ATP-binding protein [Bdellovibrionales bacterium GWC1_52_8]HAR41514.1 ABC transporter ATP-binding protein [Bdellovibrionales bacterium]HCM38848.1 ABC transporter ATP-binding protein [Bdellovibrionales bacterium]
MKHCSIEVQSLKKKLGSNQAIDGISAVFAPGVLHGLIGPEGAGKTTLLRLLLGLLRPDEGSVQFISGGQVVDFGTVRPTIAYMPQQQSLYPDLSVSEHLDFFAALYEIPADLYREKRTELLHLTRLQPFQDRPAGQLSGGMYKKLGLMCSLLRSPEILLLDEPTNGVDPISRRELWTLLYRMREQGLLILVATAYMDEAERCGEVYLLNAGRILAQGEPKQLLEAEKVARFDELFLRKESDLGL